MFKEGDRLRIKDTPNVRVWDNGKNAVGYEFLLSKEDAKYFNNDNYHMLENNRFKINFKKDDFELVTPAPAPTSSKPLFKVGDWVTITKGHRNWNNDMDKFVGRTVKITSTNNHFFSHYGKQEIKFDGSHGWIWVYEDGHFVPATSPAPLVTDKQKFVDLGETNLDKAKRLFKPGTKFISPETGWESRELEVADNPLLTNDYSLGKPRLPENEYILVNTKNNSFQYLYLHEKWAKIVEPVEKSVESNLEKAKRLYTPGTLFKSVYKSYTGTLKVVGTPYEGLSDDIMVGATTKNGDTGNFTIYQNGEWGEIVAPTDNRYIPTKAAFAGGEVLIHRGNTKIPEGKYIAGFDPFIDGVNDLVSAALIPEKINTRKTVTSDPLSSYTQEPLVFKKNKKSKTLKIVL